MATLYISSLLQPTPRQSQSFVLSRLNIDKSEYTDAQIKPGFTPDGIPKYYKLKSLSIYLVASAEIADRYVYIQFQKYQPNEATSTGYINIPYKSNTIAASQTGKLLFTPFIYNDNASLYGISVISMVGFNGIELAGPDIIFAGVSNSQTGDKWTFAAELEYLNNTLGITEK